jgi:hypothetical protein
VQLLYEIPDGTGQGKRGDRGRIAHGGGCGWSFPWDAVNTDLPVLEARPDGLLLADRRAR